MLPPDYPHDYDAEPAGSFRGRLDARLLQAAHAGDAKMVRRCLGAGADSMASGAPTADMLARGGMATALEFAARQGHPDILGPILAARAASGQPCCSQTALEWTPTRAKDGIECLRMLLRANAASAAPISELDLDLPGIMRTMISASNSRAIAALAAIGYAEIEVKMGMSALMWAAAHDTGCLLALLDAGADPDRPLDAGMTPLMYAALASPERAEVLIALARVDARNYLGENALMVAASYYDMSGQSGAPDSVALLALACDPLATDNEGRTALMKAVQAGAVECVDALAPFGGRLTLASSPQDAACAIAKAAKAGRADIVARIEAEALADLPQPPWGSTGSAKPRL